MGRLNGAGVKLVVAGSAGSRACQLLRCADRGDRGAWLAAVLGRRGCRCSNATQRLPTLARSQLCTRDRAVTPPSAFVSRRGAKYTRAKEAPLRCPTAVLARSVAAPDSLVYELKELAKLHAGREPSGEECPEAKAAVILDKKTGACAECRETTDNMPRGKAGELTKNFGDWPPT
jgi:hypothetical protein